ncbi:MalY/PatB family protein [Ornithobacterium rhinotracheale]|nr:PatB family C-S lyase [Ornithobacterium rhinotracheale]MCK0203077.1 PatB family C-S lyase [Ornithobacterium rhinotracheale]
MTEYNFDEVVDRRGTGALKIEALKTKWGRTDLIPLWVADMDFKTPKFVVEAVQNRLNNEIFGYTSASEDWYHAIIDWQKRRNQWEITKEMISFVPGVVPGLSFAVQCFTSPGDKVLIMPPVYQQFGKSVRNHDRELVLCPLKLVGMDYTFDFALFEQRVKDCKLFLLCNPHNPGGKVWRKEELQEIARICKKHKVLVVSDEIHSDLTFAPHKHHPFSSVSEEARDNNVTFNAPSKAFNLAGFCSSFAIIENPEIRKRFVDFTEKMMVGDANVFAYLTTTAAYNNGEKWLEAVKEYIEQNILYLDQYLKEHAPKIKAVIPQASYLVFLDCRELNLSQQDLVDFFVDKAHLALNLGEDYGENGKGFMRINLAAPRVLIQKALDQIKEAYKEKNFS